MARDPASSSREAIVLVPGFVEAIPSGSHRAGGTVTLITGDPLVIVDTGGPEQRRKLLDALGAAGVDPAAIEYVINTHGHLDHVGNNNLFPGATFILDGDVARRGEYRVHDFRTRAMELAANGGRAPIRIMLTPGHTDHDLSVLVETADGTIAVVGDLFEYEGDAADDAWVAWSKDRERQQESRNAVLALADYIIPGHGSMFRVTPREKAR